MKPFNLLSDMEESINRMLSIERALALANERLVRIKNSHEASFSHPKQTTIKLPVIKLPTFSGNPLDWPHFWDVFNNYIHSRADISGAQKFTYLTGQLQGKALELIEGSTTDVNYEEAIRLLEETYCDP